MTTLLMPKATAVWLVENTSLSFDQIAGFCGLHPLEVKGIADGDVAQGIKGLDPILTGQLTREEIDKGVADPEQKLVWYDLRLLEIEGQGWTETKSPFDRLPARGETLPCDAPSQGIPSSRSARRSRRAGRRSPRLCRAARRSVADAGADGRVRR